MDIVGEGNATKDQNLQTNIHSIKLPADQAKWWKETCDALGIDASFWSSPDAFELAKRGQMIVVTVCSDEDREAAWTLFQEQVKLKLER